MRYFYERPENWERTKGVTHVCDHPLYSSCTLYSDGSKGLAVIQQRFNSKTKMTWWGPIDPWLVDDLYSQPKWSEWFDQHADSGTDGIFPTFTIRQVMYALKMKPLKRHIWECDSRELLRL